MGKKKIFASLVLCACMALGVVGFTACGQDGKSAYDIWLEQGNTGSETDFLEWLKGDTGDPGEQGESAYDIWKENGHSGTESEFLDWLKGEKGDTGDIGPQGQAGTKWFTGTDAEPSATLGVEGDFYLNTATFHLWMKGSSAWSDLGSIKGEDGKTPTIKDGSWWIGDTNTGISPYGTQWRTGTDSQPAETLGRTGDFYFNTKTFDLWLKESSGWQKLGCLKSQGGSEEEVVKEFKGQTIPAGTEGLQLDVSDIDTTVLSGKYKQLYVIVETSTTAQKGVLSIRSSTYSYTKSKSWDMFSPVSNQFKAPITRIETGNKSTVLDKFTIINNSGAEITADIKIVPYTPPVLKAGEVDIFASPDKYDIFQLAIDPSLQNQTVKMTLTYYPTDEMFDTATLNLGDKRENGTHSGDDWVYDNIEIGSNTSCYFRAGESIGKIAKLKIEVIG